jgi:hypothetical protein
MQIPGNLWIQVWETAVPVPVSKQKSLIDHTTQAEKVCCIFVPLISISVASLFRDLVCLRLVSTVRAILELSGLMNLQNFTNWPGRNICQVGQKNGHSTFSTHFRIAAEAGNVLQTETAL